MNISAGYNLDQWQELYNECTPEERLGVVTMMLGRIESRKQKTYDTCKNDPESLSALPVSTLREVAELVSMDAHFFILSTCPELREIVSALEGLTVFSFSEKEPTETDLSAARTNMQTVWKAESGSLIDSLQLKSRLSRKEVLSARKPKRKARNQ